MTYIQGESSETSSVNSTEDTTTFTINTTTPAELVEDKSKLLKSDEKDDLIPETRDLSNKDEMLIDEELLLQEKLSSVDDESNFDHLKRVSEVGLEPNEESAEV